MFFSPPLDSAVGRSSLLPLPAFSSHSISLILVSLYSFNKVFIFTNQQHYSTASGFLKNFFCSQTNSTTTQLLVSISFYIIILRKFQLEKLFSLTTNHQHYRTASGFFPFYENSTQGFSIQTFTLITYHQHYRTAAGFSIFSPSNTNYQYYHTAFGFLKHLSQTTGTTSQLLVFYKFTCSQIIGTTVQHLSF